MREELVQLILERLDRDAEAIKRDFETAKGVKTRFTAIDNLLPEDLAQKIAVIARAVPLQLVKRWRQLPQQRQPLINP